MCESRAVEANSSRCEGLRWRGFTAGSKKCLMSQSCLYQPLWRRQTKGGEEGVHRRQEKRFWRQNLQNLVTLPWGWRHPLRSLSPAERQGWGTGHQGGQSAVSLPLAAKSLESGTRASAGMGREATDGGAAPPSRHQPEEAKLT